MKIQYFSSIILIFTLAISYCCLAKAAGGSVKADSSSVINTSPNDTRKYDIITLGNELEVILISDPSAEASGAVLTVYVGQYQDPESQQGMAHYLEHMLFMGTKKFPDVNGFHNFVEEGGGVRNAFTSTETTSYFFAVSPAAYDEGLDRFSEFFKTPLFDETYSSKEITVIDNEWSMYRQNDERISFALLGETINQEHPLSRFGVGNLQTLSNKLDSILHEELLAFYQRYYSANNMKLALVGKQSIVELKALAVKYFSPIPNHGIERPKVDAEGYTENSVGQHVYYASHKDAKKLSMIFPVVDNSDKWRVKPNFYLVQLLTSAEPGTLFDQLKARGLINDLQVSVAPNFFGRDGFLGIELTLTEQGLAQKDTLIASVFAYIELIRKSGLQEGYYQEMKALSKKTFQLQKEVPSVSQAIGMTRLLFDRPARHLLDADTVFNAFDSQAIIAVLDQLKPSTVVVWHESPDEAVDTKIPYFDGMYSVKKINDKELKRWQVLSADWQFNLPPINNDVVADTGLVAEALFDKPTKVMDEPGVEAWLMHSQHHQDEEGLFRLIFDGDMGDQDARSYVLGCLLNDVFTLRNTALIKRSQRKNVDIVIERTPHNSQFVNLLGVSKKQPKVLSQLMDSFIGLQFEKREFDNVLDRFKSWVDNNRKDDVLRQLHRNIGKVVFQPSWLDDQILEAANTVSVDDLKAYHQQVVNKQFLRVFAFGNYSDSDVVAMIENVVRSIGEQRKAGSRHWKQSIELDPKNISWLQLDIEKTGVALADVFIYPEQSVEKLTHINLFNALFNNALFAQLRTEEEMAYAVGSGAALYDRYPAFIMQIQSNNSELPMIKSRFDQFRLSFYDQFNKVDGNTITQLKAMFLNNLNKKPKNIMEEMAFYLTDFDAGNYQFDTKEKFIEAVELANKEKLANTYQDLVLKGKGYNIVVQLRGEDFRHTDFAKE
ncbi:MAG: protease-3 [Oceanicoccus sp.]|jgi:protease-3